MAVVLVVCLAFACGFFWTAGEMLARYLIYRYFSVGYRMAWRVNVEKQ